MSENEIKYAKTLGEMKTKFVDEYASYDSRSRLQLYTVIKVAAACVVLMFGVGASFFWSGKDRKPNPKEDIIVAVQESENPTNTVIAQGTASEEPQKTEYPQVDNLQTGNPQTEDSVQSQHGEATSEPVIEMDTQTRMPTQTTIPTQNQIPTQTKIPTQTTIPTQTPKPDQSQTIITASGWNQIQDGIRPCGNQIIELDQWYEDAKNYYEEVKPDTEPLPQESKNPDFIDVEAASSMYVVNPEGISWNYELLKNAPVLKGWCWFDTINVTWNEKYVLQLPKEQEHAYSNVLLIKGADRLYILQQKTDAKTLEEANLFYPETVFGDNIEVAYCNDNPTYLVENSNGEFYARVLIEDTLITIIGKGYSKMQMKYVLDNLKRTF